MSDESKKRRTKLDIAGEWAGKLTLDELRDHAAYVDRLIEQAVKLKREELQEQLNALGK